MSLLRRNLWVVLGLALLSVGIGVLLASAGEPSKPMDFGWFAYTPLEGDGAFGTEFVIVSRHSLVGAVIAVLGLLVIACGLGYRIGQRRARAS